MGSFVSSRRSLSLIALGGCLAMVFVGITSSPLATEFYRSIGATEFHFGLLGGIPMVLLFLQFLGAFAATRVRKRKIIFMVCLIASRLLYVPMAVMPLLFPAFRGHAVMLTIVALMGISVAIVNIAAPLWVSWMSDVIPHRVLNTYWGTRQKWMNIVTCATLLAVTAVTYAVHLPVIVLFPIVSFLAVVAGVVDIILFTWVNEPPNAETADISVVEVLIAPFRDVRYRVFMLYQCAWSASTMCAAAFMNIYLLKELRLSVWETTLIWCVPALGSAISASEWGRIADRHGHRPVLIFCTYFKTLVVVAFLFITPLSALWILPAVLLFDGAWNSGNVVATNGYIMKLSPKKNRAMFVAAFTGFAGISGGLSAILAGTYLESLSWFRLDILGRCWSGYHILFLISLFMRVGCMAMVHGLREPESTRTASVIDEMLGVWPISMIRYPIDLARKHLVEQPRA